MVQLPQQIRLPHEVYADPNAVFHVVFRAAVAERPFHRRSTGSDIWQLLLNERTRPSIELIAACLMPDHLHAVVSPREKNIIKWVDGFKSFSTRVAQPTFGERILWQPGFYDRRLRDQAEFEAAVLYVVNNPVAAGLVEDISEWPWVGSWVEG
jgi:REP element-mobilizing transposase RayT